MDVFALRDKLVEDYNEYTRSFIKIGDSRIERFVTEELNAEAFWPEPLIQLNPSFESGGTIDDLVEQGILHPKCSEIFRLGKSDEDPLGKELPLYRHQRDAILKAKEGRSYVLTSGTGSGKSLTYIVPIVSHVLHRGSGKGIQAIVVYPMNALANSQAEELSKYLQKVYPERLPPVRFARYTGQERGVEREQIRTNPPDILLTNYMMLELLLTRREDAGLVEAARALRFLVFDELHTYRGRQGADVAMLIRRCRWAFGAGDIVCVGTSATMASEGTSEDQKQHVAQVAQKLFGVPFTPDQIIGETLERATRELDFNAPDVIAQLRQAIETDVEAPDDTDGFCSHPLSSWIESAFGIRTETETGRLVRQAPRHLLGDDGAAEALARITSMDSSQCAHVIRRFLLKGSQIHRSASSRFPVFAFRLHQFFTRGDTVWTTIEPEDQRHLELSKKISKPGEPQKLLFPLVFCRHCGAAYYRVKVAEDEHGRRLLPREDRREEDEHLTTPGYLFISSQRPWPRTMGPEMLERLPDFMKEWTAEETERPARDAQKDLPKLVFVDASGRIVSEGEGLDAAFIQGHFPFCLHCGAAYTRHQRAERTKLATLGVDNRSTATTILAIRALIELQGDAQLRREARKLLSFTDNRQDASLQAGHFNDFAQVALLRSGLFKALQTGGAPSTLNPGPNRTDAREGRSPEDFHSAEPKHYQLSQYVLDAMGLPFEEYASDPDVRGQGRQATENVLRQVIEYFLYRDLQRGWRVTAPNLDFGSDDVEATHSLATAMMKRCAECGYAHMEQGLTFAEICDRCGTTLDGSARIDNLVHMQNVSLQPAQRITCDEEERQRFGYRIVTAYRFPEVGGRLDRRDAEVRCNGDLILRLFYGDAADLFRINLGWSNQRPDQPAGFNLDLERGYWSRNQADAEDADNPLTPGRVQRVVPYIRDTKNALVMSFDPPPNVSEMVGLQAAFKEAIQKYFQIEPRELGCEPLPDANNRREILFYEASEGGAGVLRQIVDDPSVFPALAQTALEICHFDPVTLEDKASNTCGQACYACLLDYGNQPDHRYLDRYLIRDFLARLTAAQCRPSGGVGSREERLAALRKRCDSAMEKKWLDVLDELLLNPPSDAQVLIEACHTRPDFFYADTNAAIYIDGPPHDDPAQIREDEAVTQRLMEHGYIVIRFHHKDDWTEIFRRHPDIFGRIGS
ncbi:MAG: DEAD/DEAH box helicase [Thermodesulfobacteriota bacterium]|nr:DEAD/DEAH box helicase [Thermodesulfobacteriota bacterium]